MIIYGIKNCDSVKKAIRFCKQNELAYQFHDFREQGITENILKAWLTSVEWTTLLNKRSTTFKQLSEQDKENLTEASALQLMLKYPTLIKRPVVQTETQLIVGFQQEKFQELVI